MAQNIGMYLVADLHGDKYHKEYLGLNFAKIHSTASLATEEYPWIISVDEYGHTFVNHYQAKHLIQEIEQLNLKQENREETQKIVESLKNLSGEQLIYFDGD